MYLPPGKYVFGITNLHKKIISCNKKLIFFLNTKKCLPDEKAFGVKNELIGNYLFSNFSK
mgnify:CR=1 FL=1